MFGEHLLRLIVRVADDGLNLLVNLRGGLLGIVRDMTHLLAEERIAAVRTIRNRTKTVAHAVLCDHRADDLRGALNVVRCARGNIVKHQGFRHTAAQQHDELLAHLVAALVGLILRRQVHRVAACHAARDDGNLVHRVLRIAEVRRNGVSCLVVRGQLLLFVCHHAALLFGADNDLDRRFLDFLHRDGLVVLAGRKQRRFV